MGQRLKIGIVGTGFIADVMAGAIARSEQCVLSAVSSRHPDRARDFAKKHQVPASVVGHEALCASEVDAVYVATPTSAKETVALHAAACSKHLLIDKPFASVASFDRIADAASNRCLMDATHFVHHPRTEVLRRTIVDELGGLSTLRAAFYFPFADETNIRYDPAQEPSGGVGDLAWYTARAAVEFMDVGAPLDVCVHIRRMSGAIVHADGLLRFDGDKTSTFSVGYDAGAVAMDLHLIGPKAMVWVDDFVLDWARSFGYQVPGHRVGFRLKKGLQTPPEIPYVDAHSDISQETLMMDGFARACADPRLRDDWKDRSRKTQAIVDAILAAES